MIVQLIIDAFLSILNFIVGLIHLPAAPLVWYDAINKVLPFFAIPVSVLRTYVGPQFFDAMLLMVSLAIAISITLRPSMWLYNKIRGSGGGN